MARMRPRVITRKHIVQLSLQTATAGNRTNNTIVDSVAVLAKNTPSEVEEGSTISAVYCEYWLTTNTANMGTAIFILEKVSGQSTTSANAGEMASLDTYPNKKNILYTFMGLTNNNVGVSMPIIRKWVKIPKSKQRFGLGDKLVMTYLAQTEDHKLCGFALYKEQK